LTAQPEVSHTAPADEPPAQQAWGQGRIALHVRVGVTGHRNVDSDDPALKQQVREALRDIESRCPEGSAATPVNLAVVSALAEGADRIVAREAMDRGVSLEVVLPLPPDDYLTDFEADTSKSEFRTLLGKASAITEVPIADDRKEAYERAGQAIVDRSDVLLALWDGHAARGRGGTAHIVSYARRQGVPVLQVPVKRLDPSSPPPRNAHEPSPPGLFALLSASAFELLDRYNSGPLRTGRTGSEPQLLPRGLKTPVPAQVHSFVTYAQPYFNRAEHVAGFWQRLFNWLALLLYVLSAAAVIIVATQIIFKRSPTIVWAEVAVLAAVVVVLAIGRWAHLHDRWLAARYLAERIRSGVFVAAVGGGGDLRSARDGTQSEDSGPPDSNQEWVELAFREIYLRARRSPPAAPQLSALKDLLIEAWIDDQACYHSRVYKRMTRRHRQLTLLAAGLFGVSALAAVFHSMSFLQSDSGYDVWGYLSVIIPAVAAAMAGYSAQRDYPRLAERSKVMVRRLQEVRQLVEDCGQLSSLQEAARKTELLMRSETAEWYEVIRLKDLELPA